MKFEIPLLEFRQFGHSPHGECGLKLIPHAPVLHGVRHSPHGECGLKSKRST